MDFIGEDYQKKRIQKNQHFLVGLLNLHLGKYFPLRKWIGIDFKGQIDDVSSLSIGYNTQYFQKKGKWYKQQTRTYQQPDLGYKLNLVLDKIPQLVLLPALLQPAYRLASVLLFSLTTYTYQPSTADTNIRLDYPDTNYGTLDYLPLGDSARRVLLYFNTTDIPIDAIFTQGDVVLYMYYNYNVITLTLNRMTRTNWTETGATWNKYDGTNAWTTIGGDYIGTNSIIFSNITGTGWKTWSSATLIQDCYNNQSRAVHLLLKGEEQNRAGYSVNFYSREYTTDTALRPKLTVTYTVETTTVLITISLLTKFEALATKTAQDNCALITELEPNKWSKEPQNTSTWVKESTHDVLYIS